MGSTASARAAVERSRDRLESGPAPETRAAESDRRSRANPTATQPVQLNPAGLSTEPNFGTGGLARKPCFCAIHMNTTAKADLKLFRAAGYSHRRRFNVDVTNASTRQTRNPTTTVCERILTYGMPNITRPRLMTSTRLPELVSRSNTTSYQSPRE